VDLEIDFQRFAEDPGQADLKGRVRLGVVLAERYQPLRALAKQRPVKSEGGEIAPAQGISARGDDETVEGLKAGEGGGDPFVEEEAEEKKHGGRAKHHRKHGGHVDGHKGKHRMVARFQRNTI
jgi:hypothetical protein